MGALGFLASGEGTVRKDKGWGCGFRPPPHPQSRKEAELLSDFHVGLMCKILLEESILLWEKKIGPTQLTHFIDEDN